MTPHPESDCPIREKSRQPRALCALEEIEFSFPDFEGRSITETVIFYYRPGPAAAGAAAAPCCAMLIITMDGSGPPRLCVVAIFVQRLKSNI